LIVGNEYFFELSASNSFAESMERSHTKVLFKTLPKQPTNLRLTSKTETEAAFAWDPIKSYEDKGGFAAVNFVINI
jgi:hypothetical protein